MSNLGKEYNRLGRKALLFNATKGTLVEGDGAVALSDNSWYLVDSKASTGSQLPFEVGYLFKTPDSANAITPIAGDKVYPITLTRICKADVSYSMAPETYSIPDDDCNPEGGVMSTRPTGYIDYTGTINSYLKMKSDGFASEAQKDFLSRFVEKQTDDGAGTYTLTERSDEAVLLATILDEDNVAVGGTQAWLILFVTLTNLTFDKALKDSQVLNSDWSAAGGPATIYERVTNASESVF